MCLILKSNQWIRHTLNVHYICRRCLAANTGDGLVNDMKSRIKQKLTQLDESLKSDPNSPLGRMDRTPKSGPQTPASGAATADNPFAAYPDGRNPSTGETGGPTGPEPTRYGDWERKGRVTDF